MIIRVSNHADRIRLIAIENMKGAFGNGGALRFYRASGMRVCPPRFLRDTLRGMRGTLNPPKIADRLKQARRVQSEIDKLQRKLGTLLNGVPKNLLVRDRYGFTAAEMTRIARQLHARAKEKITRGRSREFRGSIEEI